MPPVPLTPGNRSEPLLTGLAGGVGVLDDAPPTRSSPRRGSAPRPLSEGQLAALDERFQREPAEAVVAWAVEQFHPRLCVAASMSDAVLIDLVLRAEPSVEIVFIDTGFHFPETMETLERVQLRYGVKVRVMGPPAQLTEYWKTDPLQCCSTYKVAQLDIALESKQAWMSGLRRAESTTRSDAPVVSRDRRGLVKVNPLAMWSDDDVSRYVAAHDVPVNPLMSQGYPSIGCWPCTRPVQEGEHARAGRWPGSAKTECGLHL